MAGNMFQIAGQSNLDAARVGFHVAFLDALEAVGPDPLEMLYTEVPSQNSIEEWQWIGDLPGFEEWRGDRRLGEMAAYKLRVENKDWSNGIRIHQNQLKDDQLGLIAPKVQGLARKARRHRSDLMVQMLLNGFDGLEYPKVGNGLAYDGAFFFSASHSSGGGPNQSNLMTSALSATALASAEQKLLELKSADGLTPLDLHATHLIVGPKLADTARRLMIQDYVPSGSGMTGPTESNIWKGRFEPLISQRMTGTYDDWWFLADLSGPIKPGLFQMREEISSSALTGDQGGSNDSIPRFQRGEIWFGAEARYNVGYLAWQTVVGSKVA